MERKIGKKKNVTKVPKAENILTKKSQQSELVKRFQQEISLTNIKNVNFRNCSVQYQPHIIFEVTLVQEGKNGEVIDRSN